jgi:hypothetical protein
MIIFNGELVPVVIATAPRKDHKIKRFIDDGNI